MMTTLGVTAQIDRRRLGRYPVIEGVIVALMPQAEVLGQMLDISTGGLSFCYIDSVFEESPSSELLILLSKPRFCLDKIPYQTVADFPIRNEFSFSSIPVRRRCVRFQPLNREQQSHLKWFIINCSGNGSRLRAAIAH
jgi:hypothetical protein